MRSFLFMTALLGASAWAQETTTSMAGAQSSAQPGALDLKGQKVASCPNKMAAAGLSPGLGDQMVTVVQVSNQDAVVKYFPDNIMAPVGSIVQFQFNPKNHTVTESSFADPCKPLAANLTSATRPGQKSGFVPVTAQDTDMKVYNLLVNDTKPIWIYCGQATHCQQGMVMVINQNQQDQEKTLDNYKLKAAQVAPPPGMTVPPAAAVSTSTGDNSTTSSGDSNTALPSSSATSTTSKPPPGSGPVASGAAAGTPAALTGFANPQTVPFRHAGLFVLGVAAAAALL